MQPVMALMRFTTTGISKDTAKALIEAGVDAPERLLFMSDADLKAIKGIGPTRRADIDNYRAKYLPAKQ